MFPATIRVDTEGRDFERSSSQPTPNSRIRLVQHSEADEPSSPCCDLRDQYRTVDPLFELSELEAPPPRER